MTQLELKNKVQHELDLLEPYITSHGGKITLIGVKDFDVELSLQGACSTCPLSFYTLTYGLEKKMRSSIHPSIRVIVEE